MQYTDDNTEFDWDFPKNDENIGKHGISFDEARRIWLRPGELIIKEDTRHYNEDRFIAVGILPDKRVLIVVHTYRDEVIWIISAREAKPKERKHYYENLHRP